ncbi:twin-arginine translocase subunit TatB [Roseibium denhamense]|uniref:Sec-independent protein translocase protein TatB n=1 Tax=Roseibium denhamense TaxID=76305 RepID=A0ABY1PGU5_9HYPH|nr:Sec-independent protein translocase protein TatB [Roseibium denhamense]MTI06162.1 twin-arginine translocase subunit TatB [Roseibium denhamense]SMP32327.1 sec-independent protein translocase protein TatB [Roseibium denhamense]
MFDIGWTEILVIACIAIIVVGPKELPRMLRNLGKTLGNLRRMSREFQSTFNEALREAEQQADIADMKKQVESAANFNPLGDLKKSIEEDFEKKTPSPANGNTAADKDADTPADEIEAPAVQAPKAAAQTVTDADKKPATEEAKA